ncbi:GNAT family N-acetyltransferase [Microlunatus speluncae]|uniref:GNAT family N-acetyltransferase n=1 Tax=Microlunatus speluncae TaxID=2594267 RepID=UPI0012661690|nr:GNAT family protein [Microlunatus speluncae]
MISDIWPVYRLQITTDRLMLRLPNEQELAEVAEVAGAGVHHASERPFLTPWTEGSARDRALAVVRGHWGQLADWAADRWGLGLGVFVDGRPIGMVSLRARDFRVVREVTTSSWLGLPYQAKGFGTEARIGLLTLAFDFLRAEAALTEVFQDNYSSQGVSRKLGYEPDGVSRDARGDEVLISDRLRLTRQNWIRSAHPRAAVAGFEACHPCFGG